MHRRGPGSGWTSARSPGGHRLRSGPGALAVALLALVMGSPPGPAFAQQGSAVALSAPYRPAADTANAPHTDPLVDVAGRLLGLPPLRTVALPAGHREIRLRVYGSYAIPHFQLRVVAGPDSVRGELVRFWSLTPDPANDSIFGDFIREMRQAAGRHGCREHGGPDPSWDERTVHHYEATDWVTACREDFGAGEPSWPAVLDRLERLRAFQLTGSGLRGPDGRMVLDGTLLEGEALVGDRYTTFVYGSPFEWPWPEAARADSLVDLVQDLVPPLSGKDEP